MKETKFIQKKCKNILSITSIVTLHYFEFANNYEFKGESHPFWELLYVDKGEFLVTANGEEHILTQGEAIFHKPDEFHTNKAHNNTSSNIFVITFVCNSSAMKFFYNKHIKFNKQYKKLIGNIIETSRVTYDVTFNDVNARELVLCENSMIGGQQLIRIYLEQLLLLLMQEGAIAHNQEVSDRVTIYDNTLVNEVIAVLNEHLYDNITIDEICTQLNYSKTYLSTLFKKETKKSIVTYYRSLKITEAKYLLRTREYNISQVSVKLNFANPYYFSKVFKEVTGMSPREYLNLVID